MRWKHWLLFALLLIVLGVLARLSLFTVDRNEFVYLTQFGRPVHIFDGETEAGLHLKWPWPIQSEQRFDRRLQYLDLPGAELLTRDQRRATIDKTLTIDAYLCWRIPNTEALERFVQTVGSAEGARAVLTQRVNSDIGAAVGQMELDDLVGVGVGAALPQAVASAVGLAAGPLGQGPLGASLALAAARGKVDLKREELRRRLLTGDAVTAARSLQSAALQEYGVEIVDLRLRRLSHPSAVRQAIFERIISEREKKVADYQSEGEKLAADIRSAGERRVAELKAQADARAIELRGQADAEADHIRNEAALLDPQFYTFLRKLEDYQRFLGDNKTVLLLSTHRELFDGLFKPPAPAAPEAPPARKEGN
jgi:membrane protease subunit HflC